MNTALCDVNSGRNALIKKETLRCLCCEGFISPPAAAINLAEGDKGV